MNTIQEHPCAYRTIASSLALTVSEKRVIVPKSFEMTVELYGA